MNKKFIAAVVAGVVIIGGALSPFIVQAATGQKGPCNRPPMSERRFDPDKAAQRMADTFGVSKEDILKYSQQGIHFRELWKASFLAKASGKSLQEVMTAKTYDNTWKDVAQSLGITREMLRSTRQDLAATRLESKLSIARQVSLPLLQQGYHSRDIAVANELAQNTGKPIMDILSMKQINNTWFDVATSLGVAENTFKEDIGKLKAAFPHRGFQRGHAPMM